MCSSFSAVLSSSGIRCWFWIHETMLCVSCCGGCSCIFPKPVPGAGQLQRGQAVLAKLCWQEGLIAAREVCCGVPSPTGRSTCDKTAYRPGSLVVQPADLRLCSESSTLHLQLTGCKVRALQRCKGRAGVPSMGGWYLKWGPRAALPTVGCARCALPHVSSQPLLLACEGPTATTVCAPAGLVPRRRAAWAETCFPLLFPIFCRLFPSA